MTRHSWHTLQVVKRAAAFRLRQLWDELAMLMGSFPDLRDAFDPDELPLEFILKRDSQTDPSVTRLRPMPARVWERPGKRDRLWSSVEWISADGGAWRGAIHVKQPRWDR